MQVAVIGGGVTGVCTAYFLAAAGHEVVVLERAGNVAQESSFGNSGILSAGASLPWAVPGMPRKILSHFLKSESPALLNKTLDPSLWRWIRKWLSECEIERFAANRITMQRIASYSGAVLKQLDAAYELEYEYSSGVTQLFRNAADLKLAQPALDLLPESGIEHRILDEEQARHIEPALNPQLKLAGALHFPNDGTGNCPLFTRHLKNIAHSLGAEFYFNSAVESLTPEGGRISFLVNGESYSADAVIVAAGAGSDSLLKPLGIELPVYPVKTYSATAFIKNFDQSPKAAVIDEAYKVAVARMGSRIRVSGIAELGSESGELHSAALRTLVKVGEECFPDAANYSSATFWCGLQPTLPDGPPLLGPTPIKNLYLNIGHGLAGWSMAAGSGKIIADLISGSEPEINLDGLTLSRFS